MFGLFIPGINSFALGKNVYTGFDIKDLRALIQCCTRNIFLSRHESFSHVKHDIY